MTYIIAVAGRDGRAKFKPYKAGTGDYKGTPFLIGDVKIKTEPGNIVTIPKRVFEKYGYLRTDGRYALALDAGWTTVNKERSAAAEIVQDEKVYEYLEMAENGDIVMDEDLYPQDDDKYLKPKDVKHAYGDL